MMSGKKDILGSGCSRKAYEIEGCEDYILKEVRRYPKDDYRNSRSYYNSGAGSCIDKKNQEFLFSFLSEEEREHAKNIVRSTTMLRGGNVGTLKERIISALVVATGQHEDIFALCHEIAFKNYKAYGKYQRVEGDGYKMNGFPDNNYVFTIGDKTIEVQINDLHFGNYSNLIMDYASCEIKVKDVA